MRPGPAIHLTFRAVCEAAAQGAYMTPVWMKRSAMVFFAAVAFTVAVPAVQAATRLGVDLSPANAASGARGRATVVVRRLRHGLDATLAVVVRKLRPSTTYDVTADGMPIGTVTTDGAGNGRAHFRSHPRGQDQALGVDPRGKTIGV